MIRLLDFPQMTCPCESSPTDSVVVESHELMADQLNNTY